MEKSTTSLLIVLGIGLALSVVGLSTPGWFVTRAAGITYATGLWQSCADRFCISIGEVEDAAFNAVRAFTLLGMFGAIAGETFAILATVITGSKSVLLYGSVISSSIAGSFSLLGVIIFIIKKFVETNIDDGHLGYSVYITIVAIVFLFVASGLASSARKAPTVVSPAATIHTFGQPQQQMQTMPTPGATTFQTGGYPQQPQVLQAPTVTTHQTGGYA